MLSIKGFLKGPPHLSSVLVAQAKEVIPGLSWTRGLGLKGPHQDSLTGSQLHFSSFHCPTFPLTAGSAAFSRKLSQLVDTVAPHSSLLTQPELQAHS